jgi:hypothetical protein
VGALERIESGGALRIVDALFVARQPESGELVAVTAKSEGSAGMIGRLLSFRLDERTRATATSRALEGPAAIIVRSLAAELEPGEAFAAIIVEHAWFQTLSDAVARMGAASSTNEFVEVAELTEVASRLSAGARTA